MVNLMFDRRIVRGNTYSANSSKISVIPAQEQKAPRNVGSHPSLRTRVLSRRSGGGQRPQPGGVGRREGGRLEELHSVTEEKKKCVVETVKVESVSALLSEEETRPKPSGCSRGTQILPSDCIINNFDNNVKKYLESIVALTVKKSMRECLEEEDRKLSRKLQLNHEDNLMSLKI